MDRTFFKFLIKMEESKMGLNKKSVDDINAKGKRVLVRCDFNVPLKNGEITDEINHPFIFLFII